jgi:hypothetical protein
MQLARSCRGAVVALVALGVALVAVASAQAGTKRISDGNDRPGPLDIRSATHGHSGDQVVHAISTFSRWRVGLLGRNNILAIEISIDGDPALERVVIVFSRNGRLIAQVVRLPAGTTVGSASTSRPNGRTVRVSIRRSLLGNPVGYRWNAHTQYQASGACNQFCVDRAPNRGRVLHDITSPRVVFPAPPIPASTEYDLNFTVSDSGGSGLRSWRLEHRALGNTAWSTIASGTTAGSKSRHHVAAEDDDDQFRLVARDRQGNTSVSPIRLVSVPIDDASSTLVYTGTWSHGPGSPLDFLGTISATSGMSDTAELAFTGRYVAWVAPGGGDGEATVEIVGQSPQDVSLADFSGRRKIVFQHTFASVGTHTLRITRVFGTVPVDGIIVR